MALTEALKDIEYPESDGQPMGESDLHRYWIIRLSDQLAYRYRNRRVYVAADLLMYFEEGDPNKVLVPDVFLVKDCDPGLRNTFLIWKEQRVPNVVFEVTSKSTRRNDETTKALRYAEIGVRELILFDPTSDYLKPPLQIFQLVGSDYVRQEPDADGRIVSEELDVILFLEGDRLVLLDRFTQEPLLTEVEAQTSRADEATARAEEEARKRLEFQAENERLREFIRRHGLSD